MRTENLDKKGGIGTTVMESVDKKEAPRTWAIDIKQ